MNGKDWLTNNPPTRSPWTKVTDRWPPPDVWLQMTRYIDDPDCTFNFKVTNMELWRSEWGDEKNVVTHWKLSDRDYG